MKEGSKSASVGPVVSASHLAAGAMPSLSEVEYALNIATNAFQRWTVRCALAADGNGFTAMEVQVLHTVNHRARGKSLSDICLLLNIEDTHLVNYAIKKLEASNMVKTSKRGKEKIVSITKGGEKSCALYHQYREELLIKSVQTLGLDAKEVSKAATLLRALSGQYDQAARSAASL